MDAYEIALMMANQDSARPLKMRYGTVSKVGIDSVEVVPDGFSRAISVVKCCHPLKGDRVVMLVNSTEWLAVSTIGGESIPPRIGQLFITATEEDPQTLWPDTSWSKLSDCSLFFSGALGDAGTY
ncbi:hypothetical protein, partial [Gordonibacter sp.]|uniref:hypothetical protein n=1 Tax=Gordonibacter sp. TaxID=1968902 RepID=UPI002FC7D2DB